MLSADGQCLLSAAQGLLDKSMKDVDGHIKAYDFDYPVHHYPAQHGPRPRPEGEATCLMLLEQQRNDMQDALRRLKAANEEAKRINRARYRNPDSDSDTDSIAEAATDDEDFSDYSDTIRKSSRLDQRATCGYKAPGLGGPSVVSQRNSQSAKEPPSPPPPPPPFPHPFHVSYTNQAPPPPPPPPQAARLVNHPTWPQALQSQPQTRTAEQVTASIDVQWRPHGHMRVLLACAPSQRILQEKALGLIRARGREFEKPDTNGTGVQTPRPLGPPPGHVWRAALRKVTLGAATYDMAGFGSDDISRLFVGNVIPEFEIVVEAVLARVPSSSSTAPFFGN